MSANIRAISYVLPVDRLSNAMLSEQHPEWPVEKIYNKTGIQSRGMAGQDEYSTDLAIEAGRKLFKEHSIKAEEIDFVIFCSQTPKFLIPSNACIIQDMLGIPTSAGALDINQGCSGYLYALMLADGLIAAKRAKNVLLLTADTYSKLISSNDRNLKTIFGDAATASVVSEVESLRGLKTFEFGTDGAGSKKLISENSGFYGLMSGKAYSADLFMDGAGIFNFTLENIPALVEKTLKKLKLHLQDIDLFIFHQANGYMLEHLREKIGICKENFFVYLSEVGNTVSSSIPIACYEAIKQKRMHAGQRAMLVGFGVGLSWIASILEF